MAKIPVTITTNQFEIENTAPAHRHVKRMLFVSNWMLNEKAKWAKNDVRARVLYNPVEKPVSSQDLRAEFNIPHDAFVLGRVGRADNGIHDPISLKAYARVHSENTYFLSLSSPPQMIAEARELGLKNFIPIPATASAERLSQFYNTIDVLAHARRDGETFGCNIAEAMIHGKPAISHISEFMNAQAEVIGDTGFVAPLGDHAFYAEALHKLITNSSLRKELGAKAKQRALDHFEISKVADTLSNHYSELLSKAKSNT